MFNLGYLSKRLVLHLKVNSWIKQGKLCITFVSIHFINSLHKKDIIKQRLERLCILFNTERIILV